MLSSPRTALLSVVMPVHNALPHLDEAVRSILNQTYRDFEFVIYDDASTDGSTARLREWAGMDQRIRLFEGSHNLGMVGSSAFVVEHSKAPLLARMDADDVCDPARLARQLELLNSQPSAGLVGTLYDIIDSNGRLIRSADYWKLARQSPLVPFAAHGSIMFRRTAFESAGGYRAESEFWEDQDLLTRLSSVAEIWIIPAPLYRVRQWAKQSSPPKDNLRIENAVDLMYRCMGRVEQRQGYDDLLIESRSKQPGRIDPRVFISTGSKLLWAGERPRLVGRFMKRAKIGFDRPTVIAFIWTVWAAVSPSTLRFVTKRLLLARNARASRFKDCEPFTWMPDRLSETHQLEPLRSPAHSSADEPFELQSKRRARMRANPQL